MPCSLQIYKPHVLSMVLRACIVHYSIKSYVKVACSCTGNGYEQGLLYFYVVILQSGQTALTGTSGSSFSRITTRGRHRRVTEILALSSRAVTPNRTL